MTKEELEKLNGQKIKRADLVTMGKENDIVIIQVNRFYEIVLSHIFPLLDGNQVSDVWLIYDNHLNAFPQLFTDFKQALETFLQLGEQRLKEAFL